MLPFCGHLLDQFHINLRLAASGDTVDQYRARIFLLPFILDLTKDFLLRFGKI